MKYSLALCLFSSTCLATAAHAQSSDSPASAQASSNVEFEEIIVTAQKRSEKLSDVPMSITAATGEQLARRGVIQVADLEKVVPGFAFQPSAYGTPVFSIRGIGFFDVAVAIAPTVSVYVDQVPLPYSVMTEGASLDVERVEVLKGPQGTLFGQNSTGGAINFIANKPTDHFTIGGSFSYGNFDAFTAKGYVSGPLSDTLSARVALSTDQRGNWQKSRTRDDGLGKRDFSTGRFLLDWNPSENLRFEFNANGWINKSDTQAAQFVLFSPTLPDGYPDLFPVLSAFPSAVDDNRIADWDPGANLERDDWFYQTSLRAEWDVTPSITITSITAYSKFKQISPTDTDGTPFDNFLLTINADIKSFSQELRVSGTSFGDDLKWMVGANYQDDSTHDFQSYHLNGSNSGIGPFRFDEVTNVSNQKIETKAIFGSLDYALLPNLTATASVRYTESKNEFRGCTADTNGTLAAAFTFLYQVILAQPGFPAFAPNGCVLSTEPPSALAPLPEVRKSLSEDNLSWRGGLSWKPTSATLVYANVTRGYKAGSFPTIPSNVPSSFEPVTQESLLAYEAGFKQSLFNRTLDISGAAFYYDYTDKQILGFTTAFLGNLPALVSIPKGRVKGAEVNVAWRPITGLTFNGGVTYIDSRVTSSFVTNDPFANPVNIKGERFPNTPTWQMAGDVQYEFPVTDTLNAYVGASGQYRNSSYAVLGVHPLFRLPAYGTLDLRAGLESDGGRWRAEIWGRNVTDRFYLTNVTHVVDSVSRTTGMPATYGVTMSFRY